MIMWPFSHDKKDPWSPVSEKDAENNDAKKNTLKDSEPWVIPDKCDDSFRMDIWNDKDQHTSNSRSSQPFSFGSYTSHPSVIGSHSFQRPEADSWSPQRSSDPLQKFRTSMQNGELSKLPDNAGIHKTVNSLSSSFASNSRRAGSLSSDDSTESLDVPPSPTTTWSAVVQKNPRPVKHRKAKPPRTFTISLPACCATPRIKLTCACCNEETFIKVKEEMKPRLIPVSTSQLGFCRFCQTNGDPPEVYQSHSLRSDDGKVSCPVLREYNCPICHNGGGDFAHTVKYCPMARKAKPTH